MKTWRDNGERWYCDDRSWWLRLRQWLVWFGGWERASGGWSFGFKIGKKFYFTGPAPLSLFGHRITYYGWGLEMRLPTGYLVWNWNKLDDGVQIYISKNGTPSQAHHWIVGTPSEIKWAAEEAQKRIDEVYDAVRNG